MENENVVKQVETKNYLVQVLYDPDPMDPITENDNLGEEIRTRPGNRHLSNWTTREIVEEYGPCVIVEIYTDNYGHAGRIYWKITKEEYLKEFKTWDHKNCIQLCESYAEEFSKYYAGEVYGFKVINKETEDEVDSCWGFIGNVEFCLNEGLDVAKYHETKEVETLQFMKSHFVT